MKFAWMLMVLLLAGCVAPKQQKVTVTTKIDPFYVQNPDEVKASCTVTYESRW